MNLAAVSAMTPAGAAAIASLSFLVLLAVLTAVKASAFAAAITELRHGTQAGDERRSFDVVRGWVVRLGVPHEDVGDVTQRVLLHALEGFGRFDPTRATFTRWLYRITANVCAKHRAHVSVRDRIELLVPQVDWAASDAAPDARLRQRALRQELATFLVALPAPVRRLLVMGPRRLARQGNLSPATLYRFARRLRCAARTMLQQGAEGAHALAAMSEARALVAAHSARSTSGRPVSSRGVIAAHARPTRRRAARRTPKSFPSAVRRR
ncbi:MAG: RNA polymerase sigma factor [Kofleriaceae bacterium]